MTWALMAIALAGAIASEAIDAQDVGPDHPLEESYVPEDLVELPVPPATRSRLQLRAPAWAALQSMLEAAREEGIELRIISAYRSFAYQRSIHDRAVKRHGSDQKWVARPGESEHQLGTTVDLADAQLQYVLTPKFASCPEGSWLAQNCERFGFRITYTSATAAELGIEPEPWHVRFLGGPLENP